MLVMCGINSSSYYHQLCLLLDMIISLTVPVHDCTKVLATVKESRQLHATNCCVRLSCQVSLPRLSCLLSAVQDCLRKHPEVLEDEVLQSGKTLQLS